MKLHTIAPSPSLQRVAKLAVLSCAVLALFGCGGSEDTSQSDALADELVSAAPASQPIPEEIADKLIAEELSGMKSSTPAADKSVAAEKSGTDLLGLGKSYCLPAVTNPVYRWNELALDAVRSGSMSDVQAARVYAMVNVAMYDAVNGIETRRGVKRAQALVSASGAPHDGSLNAAASAAARAVLTSLRPDLASVYTAQHQADLAALRRASAKQAGADWGARVGNQVVALRANDGSALNETQAANTGVGQFRASWSGTQFRNLKPFAIDNPSAYVQPGPPALNSVAYAAAFNDVKTAGNGAINNPTSLDIYNFWASKSGTSQPAGEWVKVALSLVRRKDLSIQESARLMALMGMGMSDAVAPTLTTKFNFKHWRPVTAIREASTAINPATVPDATWVPRAGLPGGTSPEYISGHSSFAGVGSTILRNFFCDDSIRFSLQTDVPATATTPNSIRSFDTFTEAANESGRSRILGGVHFEFSNQDGLKLGRGVALEVLDTALLRTQGETHYYHGHCPK
ncbi:MAG TPA: vanadium-dependent haloperoxidase [Burkholderiaceae bacterium]|nr:vanadium-dependent haloperoxidase [Burkholderiaceae bacterium]